jgi:hypothetical protein
VYGAQGLAEENKGGRCKERGQHLGEVRAQMQIHTALLLNKVWIARSGSAFVLPPGQAGFGVRVVQRPEMEILRADAGIQGLGLGV